VPPPAERLTPLILEELAQVRPCGTLSMLLAVGLLFVSTRTAPGDVARTTLTLSAGSNETASVRTGWLRLWLRLARLLSWLTAAQLSATRDLSLRGRQSICLHGRKMALHIRPQQSCRFCDDVESVPA